MNPPISIKYDNTPKDFIKAHKTLLWKSWKKKRTWIYISVIYVLVSSLEFHDALNEEKSFFVAFLAFVITFIFLSLIAVIIVPLSVHLSLRSRVPKDDGTGVLGEHELEITEEFIIERTKVNESKFLWSAVPDLTQNNEYIFLYQTENNAHVIPKRCLKSPEQVRNIFDLLSQLKRKAQQDSSSNA